ncbi:DUF2182 domain-containing protein [Solimonas variicoloris]|uniref:DUF2182 domain-containing protein n=1 Tax=Solimonas variicoloris TaxID=254408 RepID=UPI00037E50D0|nr:DUF2182 domain-containing protein [Solimonas variicoloris]
MDASRRAFFGGAALLFAGSAALTVAWSLPAPPFAALPMCGGGAMKTMWLPERSGPGAAAAFIVMWIVMMAAMMLPVATPPLWRYRQALAAACVPRAARLTALAGLGYCSVWTAAGAVVFALSVALTAAEWRLPSLARAEPLASALVVLIAGAMQLGTWKQRRLACCREADACAHAAPGAGAAWRHGLRLGRRCVACCANLTAVLLVTGLMDLRAMLLVSAAISAERLTPRGVRIAQFVGLGLIGAGLVFVARAAGL